MQFDSHRPLQNLSAARQRPHFPNFRIELWKCFLDLREAGFSVVSSGLTAELCPIWSGRIEVELGTSAIQTLRCDRRGSNRSSKSATSRSSYPTLGRKHDLPPGCLTHD